MMKSLPQGYWNPKIETMPRHDLEGLQERRLNSLVRRAWGRSPFYRRKMEQAHVKPEDINSLSDFFDVFPLTIREELQEDQLENSPYGSRITVKPESPCSLSFQNRSERPKTL